MCVPDTRGILRSSAFNPHRPVRLSRYQVLTPPFRSDRHMRILVASMDLRCFLPLRRPGAARVLFREPSCPLLFLPFSLLKASTAPRSNLDMHNLPSPLSQYSSCVPLTSLRLDDEPFAGDAGFQFHLHEGTGPWSSRPRASSFRRPRYSSELLSITAPIQEITHVAGYDIVEGRTGGRQRSGYDLSQSRLAVLYRAH